MEGDLDINTIQYMAVLDFEATCDNRKKFKTQEVIEFPTVLLRWDRRKNDVVGT